MNFLPAICPKIHCHCHTHDKANTEGTQLFLEYPDIEIKFILDAGARNIGFDGILTKISKR